MNAVFHYGDFRAIKPIPEPIPIVYLTKPKNGLDNEISYDWNNHIPHTMENVPQGRLVFILHNRHELKSDGSVLPEYWFSREE